MCTPRSRCADRSRRADPGRDPRGHRTAPCPHAPERIVHGCSRAAASRLEAWPDAIGDRRRRRRTPSGSSAGPWRGSRLSSWARPRSPERWNDPAWPPSRSSTDHGPRPAGGPGPDHRRGRRRSPPASPRRPPAITVNKVCLSGTSAIAIADQMIRAGDLEVAVAGGMESMTNAPFVLPKAREGSRLGDTEMVDSMIHDGLWCAFDDRHMGEGTDAISAELGITREDQDAWAARSHHRARDAWDPGRLAGRGRARSRFRSARATRSSLRARRGHPRPRPTPETLAKLRPAFTPDGTVTAGNASQISDGAAAVVVTSAEVAERMTWSRSRRDRGLRHVGRPLRLAAHGPRARAGEGAEAGRPRGRRPRPARESTRRSRRSLCTPRGCSDVDEDLVNVNGGAVALGHPIGASGTRIVLTLASGDAAARGGPGWRGDLRGRRAGRRPRPSEDVGLLRLALRELAQLTDERLLGLYPVVGFVS